MKFCKILLAFFLFSLQSYSQKTPTLKNIVRAFFSKYSFEKDDTYPHFIKKKDGWHIVEKYYNDPDKLTNEKLFWSQEEQKFSNLNYSLREEGDSIYASNEIANHLNRIDDNDKYFFSLHKYYGYPGWDWDIINELSRETMLSDSSLESLARAYSSYGQGFLYDQSGDLFQNGDTDRVPLKDSQSILRSRIDKFIDYQKKTIETYENLMKVNPNYQTFVGNIKIKCANEYVNLYFKLLLAEADIEVKDFLAEVDYPDSILVMAKAYLDEVPKNSILFTYGDNDTYPLWYLQEVKGYRADVLVLNKSLLGLRRYVKMLDKKFKGSLFATQPSVYYKNNFDYFIYEPNSDYSEIGVSKFISNLNNYNDKLDSTNPEYIYKGKMIKRYAPKTIYFDKVFIGKKPNVKLTKSISLNTYLHMNEFMMLDIINTNINKRPIYFTYAIPLFYDILKCQKNVCKLAVSGK